MKDQSPILEKETQVEKRERARCLFLESLHKPDHELRGCAHNQKCFNELMEIRDDIIEYVKGMRELKPGEKNDAQVKSFNGISVALLRGSLGKHYMKDWTEEQIKEYEEYLSINS